MAGNTTENELEERAKQIDVALKKALTRGLQPISWVRESASDRVYS